MSRTGTKKILNLLLLILGIVLFELLSFNLRAEVKQPSKEQIDRLILTKEKADKNIKQLRKEGCQGLHTSTNVMTEKIKSIVLKKSKKMRADPCNNFWLYACASDRRQVDEDKSRQVALDAFKDIFDREMARASLNSKALLEEQESLKADFEIHNDENADPLFLWDPIKKNLNIEMSLQGVETVFSQGFDQFHEHVLESFTGEYRVFDLDQRPLDIVMWESLPTRADKDTFFLKNYSLEEVATSEGEERLQRRLNELYMSGKGNPQKYREFVESFLVAIHRSQQEKYEDLINSAPEKSEFWKPFAGELYTEEMKKSDRSIFKEVKDTVDRHFYELVFKHSPELQKALEEVEIVSPFKFSSDAHYSISYNALYNDYDQKITILNGFRNLSQPSIWSTVAHEYGHAIDFRAKKVGGRGYKWVERVQSCLQEPGAADILPERKHEAFADWVEAEAMVEHLKGKSRTEKEDFLVNAVLDCSELNTYSEAAPGTDNFDTHSRWDIRANKIIFAHPEIQNVFGCNDREDYQPPKYCN